jgi:hypothetical protein
MKKSKDNLSNKDREYIEGLYRQSIVPLHKENDILNTNKIELSDEEKREMAEIQTQIILEERNSFNIKLHGLYSKLSNQYQNNAKANPKKQKTFLYEMIEEINSVLDNAQNKFNTSLTEYAEEQIHLLKKLKTSFESNLKTHLKPRKEVGRTKSKAVEVNELINIENGNVKIKLIAYLEENYTGCEMDEFYLLIAVLEYKKIIDLNNKRGTQLSFEKFLKPKGYNKVENQEKETIHSDRNFNKRVEENIKSFNVYRFKKGNYDTGINAKKGQAMDKLFTDLNKNNPHLQHL